MKYVTMELSKSFEHRYKFGARIYNIQKKVFGKVTKKTHTFQFREDPPESLPNKTHIYQNYFNRAGSYICVQDAEYDYYPSTN